MQKRRLWFILQHECFLWNRRIFIPAKGGRCGFRYLSNLALTAFHIKIKLLLRNASPSVDTLGEAFVILTEKYTLHVCFTQFSIILFVSISKITQTRRIFLRVKRNFLIILISKALLGSRNRTPPCFYARQRCGGSIGIFLFSLKNSILH